MANSVVDWLSVGGGLFVLVSGGELLVRGASKLAGALRISPIVVGLTVVAFGTSAPELAVSLQASLSGSADLAVGNVIGSNIFNVLFILGLSALIIPLVVASEFVRRDVPMMIFVSVVLLLQSLDQKISRWDGLALFLGLLIYTGWCIYAGRQASNDETTANALPEPAEAHNSFWTNLLYLIIGVGLLILGSNLLVSGATSIAQKLGVNELVIGLTIVAAGTSLPEVATSIIAAIKGERDIAVGNVVGSNIFNILCVLGVSALASPNGIAISDAALEFDMPVMIAVAVACWPVFAKRNEISRWEGGVFFFYYLAYTLHLVLEATGHEYQHTVRFTMLMFVVPITVLTLAVTTWRSFRK